jgi:hypothetical protein
MLGLRDLIQLTKLSKSAKDHLDKAFYDKKINITELMSLIEDGIKIMDKIDDIPGPLKKQVVLSALRSRTDKLPPGPEKDIMQNLVRELAPIAIDYIIEALKTPSS